jgi:hypothetical protein
MKYDEKKCDHLSVLKPATTGVASMREKKIRIVRKGK